jgi:diaminopimelate epimerase
MFNPDGSEFERSGNGLRVLGAYLYGRGRVRVGDPFPVEVGGETVEMEILSRGSGGMVDVAVEMGKARFGMEAVGGRTGDLDGGCYLEGPGGGELDIQPVSVGNPHCVTFRDTLSRDDLHRLGPFLTAHEAFPRGINVQLVRVTGDASVEILIWERGVGRTASSGTSACAVAAACVQRERLMPGKIRVCMEGGDFWVTVSPEGEVRLEGPVWPVMDGELMPEFQKSLLERGA